ncbi:RNA-directed DNA polymerase [Vibrio breoganii]
MLMQLLRSKENIKRAIRAAIVERTSDEHAMFYSEMKKAAEDVKGFEKQIRKELASADSYQPSYGYYYALPKSELVDRYLVYLPFKELVIRYCFVQVIADILDPQLIATCFANRLDTSESKRLTLSFANHSWPDYCHWQSEAAKTSNKLIVTDLSSFFDNIDSKKLLSGIASNMGTEVNSPFFQYFQKVLLQPVHRFGGHVGDVDTLVQRNKGIMTGPCSDSMLANFYLMDLDKKMSQLEGIEYGRYVDDIKLFGQDREKLQAAFSILQRELHDLGLNINSSKTKLIDSKEEVIELITQEIVMGVDHYGNEHTKTRSIVYEQEAKELELDLPFDKREIAVDLEKEITSASDAKEFCFILSEVDVDDWQPTHLAKLVLILKRYPSSTKHAVWQVIRAMREGNEEVQTLAEEYVTEQCLVDPQIHNYAKSRLLHHLIKPRKRDRRYVYQVLEDESFIKSIKSVLRTTPETLLRVYALEVFCLKFGAFTLPEIQQVFIKAKVPLNHFEAYALTQVAETKQEVKSSG